MGSLNVEIDTFLDPVGDVAEDKIATSFSRAINKLSVDKKHPGQIVQIGLHIENQYKILGALSINTGGSISFFPDFAAMWAFDFDHITLNHDFVNKKAHLTAIKENGKHKKVQEFIAFEQEPGEFHFVTFLMPDSDFLMNHSRVLKFVVENLDTQEEENLFIEIFKDAMKIQPKMMMFPEEPGIYCVQFIVFEKTKNVDEVHFNPSMVNHFLIDKAPLGQLNARRIRIETPADRQYDICILAVKINRQMNGKFGFNFAK